MARMPPDPSRHYARRDARPDDLERLQDVERAAGECFRGLGMPEIADDEPFPLDTLTRYQQDGRARVVEDDGHRAVAYLLTDLVDGCVHVEQVSVHPDHARRGLGRWLLDDASERAATLGAPALTLTTFRDVPWNAPYYARLGFRVVDDRDVTPQLRAVRATEAAHGLDRWPRVVMRRDLDAPA